MWRGSREPSSVFRSPPFPNSTKRGSGPLGPPGLRRPAALGGGARRRRQAQRGARARRGGRGAFKARVRPSERRGRARGGASAGRPRGFTCSSERAEQRRGRLRGRRTHRPEGARRRPTWPGSRSRAATAAARPGWRRGAGSSGGSGGGGHRSCAIRAAAGSGLRAPGSGRAPGRGAAGR